MTIKQIEEIQPEIENALIEHAEIILRSETGQKTHYISVEEVENIIDTYLNTRFAKMRYKRKYDRYYTKGAAEPNGSGEKWTKYVKTVLIVGNGHKAILNTMGIIKAVLSV